MDNKQKDPPLVFTPPKTWGVNLWREVPEAGGRQVVEVILAGYYFPFRVWGSGRKGVAQ